MKTFRYSILMLLIMFVVGCDGCRSTDTNENKPVSKARLETNPPKMLPSSKDNRLTFSKPGHWMQATHEVRSNDADESLTIVTSVTDRQLNPVYIQGTKDEIRYRRSMAIAKGQTKTPELLAFIPPVPKQTDQDLITRRNASLRISYLQRNLAQLVTEQGYPTVAMNGHTFFMPVISKKSDRHLFWQGLSSLNWPSEIRDETQTIITQRVVNIEESELAEMLPNQLLTMTAISHMVWYDADESRLSDAQRTALLDWIAFGGTFIISGPDAGPILNSELMATILPVNQVDATTVPKTIVDKLNAAWKVGDSEPLRLAKNSKVPMLSGSLREGAYWVKDCEGILAERRYGRGRVLFSTLPLSSQELVTWKSYGSFVNGAILRRPRRTWRSGALGGELQYANQFLGSEDDSDLTTELRILSRDIKNATADDPRPAAELELAYAEAEGPKRTLSDWEIDDFPNVPGTASWNDTSGLSYAAQQSIQFFSGISVPKISTILKLLAVYLIVLVPLNWAVFRLIGRVEWAWVAAPVIAVVGAAVIARSVQLDIGFSRAQTQLAILELQQDHQRGHLTGYLSLYTSLSTKYEAKLPDTDGVVLPMSKADDPGRRSQKRVLQYEFASSDGKNGLSGFPVASNTAGTLHFETMLDCGGYVNLNPESSDGQFDISNDTNFTIRESAICGFDSDGKWRVGWVGDFESGETRTVTLEPLEKVRKVAQWSKSDVMRRLQVSLSGSNAKFELSENESESLSLGFMLDAVVRQHKFVSGEFLLIGWSDQFADKIEINPVSSQVSSLTLVINHLTYPKPSPAMRDFSLPSPRLGP